MPSPSSLPSIVTIGALLTIEGERRYNGPDSEGGTGFVSRVHADGTFDINLSVGGVEKNVHPRRIQNSTPLATTARRRSIADDSATRPSLISINHVPSRRSSPVTIAADVSTIAANKNNTNNQRHDFATVAIHQVIQQCDGWHPKYSNNKSKSYGSFFKRVGMSIRKRRSLGCLSIRRRERRLSCNETGATDLCKRGMG